MLASHCWPPVVPASICQDISPFRFTLKILVGSSNKLSVSLVTLQLLADLRMPPSSAPAARGSGSSSGTNLTLYLLHVSANHPSFRIPELLSCAKTYNFPIDIAWEDEARPFVIVGLRKDAHARKLAERCMAVR